MFRWVFDEVVRRCMDAGLVKGEGFAVDASLIAANASHQHSVQPGEYCDWHKPEIDTRAMREYLAALDDDALAAAAPRKVSLSDPDSRWTAATGGIAFFAYSTNYLIDTAHGVILDVEATPAHRTAEVESTKLMVDRVEDRFALKPERIVEHNAEAVLDVGIEITDRNGFHTSKMRKMKNAARYQATLGGVKYRMARKATISSHTMPP